MMQIQHSNAHTFANTHQKSRPSPKDNKSSGRWTKEEHHRFVEGLKKFGKNWKLVEDYVATRSGAQIRSHAQKFFNRVERDFNVKLDDLHTHATKEKFNETLSKISEYGYDHNEVSVKGKNPRKQSEKTVCSSPGALSETNSKHLSMISSPKVDQIEIEGAKTVVKKISDEMKTHSFFDIIMSKIISSNNTITSPKLSDLLDLTSSSTRASFDDTNLESEQVEQIMSVQNLFNSSFKLHNKNMSEGNLMKLNQLRRPEDSFTDVEVVSKKYKMN